MKINLIVNSFPTASESFLFNLVTGLEKRGMIVQVQSLSKNNDRELYEDRITEWSGRISYYNKLKLSFFLNAIFNKTIRNKYKTLKKENLSFKKRLSTLSLWTFLHENNPAIIHIAFSGIAAEFNHVLKLGVNASLFVSCRGSAEKIRPLIDKERSSKLTQILNIADRVHCVCEDMLNTVELFGDIRHKSFVNFPSIDLTRFIYKERTKNNIEKNSIEKIKILSTGRLHFQKGYIYAIKAIKILVDKGYNIEYTVCGGGPEEGLIRYMIQELQLENNVILKGKVSGQMVKELLDDTDLFLLSSIYEGIANAALEAIASGVPIVTTKAGGMSEVINNKVNGILVDGFNIEQLVEGLEYLINNFPIAKEYAKKSYELIATKFNLENQIDIFIKEYEQINNRSL
jgi:colanic acid/amylovoran biosynthesis glycosyltransferase